MAELIEKLKQRWGLETLWQVVLILFIFAVTGISSLYVGNFIFEAVGVDEQTALWQKVVLFICIEVPIYQILFLTYGFLLGQFEFVWNFEKKTAHRIKKLFSLSKTG